MRTLIKTGTLLGALFIATSSAQAGLVVDLDEAFEGNADYYALGKNDIVGSSPGYFGAQISTQGTTTLRFEFLGAESVWQTTFNVTNESDASGRFVYNPNSDYSPVGESNQDMQAPFTMTFANDGELNFEFEVNKYFTDGNGIDRTFTNQAVNGSNYVLGDMPEQEGPRPEVLPATFWTGLEFDGDDLVSVTLALNGSHWGYNDYDNMVVRISEVPLPASIPLFMFSLVSLGLFKRK